MGQMAAKMTMTGWASEPVIYHSMISVKTSYTNYQGKYRVTTDVPTFMVELWY